MGETYEKLALREIDPSYLLNGIFLTHCTNISKLGKILDNGLKSVFALYHDEDITPDKNHGNSSGFDENIPLIVKQVNRIKQGINPKDEGDLLYYNTICTSHNSCDYMARVNFYNPTCPIAFGFNLMDIMEKYNVGVSKGYNADSLSHGDIVIVNKDTYKPTQLNLSDAEVMFFPNDVYFDESGNLVEPQTNKPLFRGNIDTIKMILETSIERLTNNKKDYRSFIEELRTNGEIEEIQTRLFELYNEAINNEEFSADLNSIEKYILREDGEYDIHQIGIAMACLERDTIAYLQRISDQKKNGEDIDEIYDKISKLLSRAIQTKSLTSHKMWIENEYEKNKEFLDSVVNYYNKEKPADLKINIRNFDDDKTLELFEILHHALNLFETIDIWNHWEKENYTGSKEFLRYLLELRGAEIDEEENELHITNYITRNLPKKIVFFGKADEFGLHESLEDTLKKYLIDNNKHYLNDNIYFQNNGTLSFNGKTAVVKKKISQEIQKALNELYPSDVRIRTSFDCTTAHTTKGCEEDMFICA